MTRPDDHGFRRSVAIVVGIDAYRHGIPPLRSAVADATAVAAMLAQHHGYDVRRLLDGDATGDGMRRELEAQRDELDERDRLLVYFAGHGIALHGDHGPAGYLIPQDARAGASASYLPMRQLREALAALACRHVLVVLDCCFAGAFRWSSTRDLVGAPEVVHRERYERYIADPAWQVLTSAGDDQLARDVLALSDQRGAASAHSPFAAALLSALRGEADSRPRDGLITATELYLYLRDRVEDTAEQHHRQTPGLWHLDRHGGGEYILGTPGVARDLPPAPALDGDANPYRGLQPYEEHHSALFFGRVQTTGELEAFVREHAMTIVVGASGTGKSSLVNAGLVPRMRRAGWQIVGPVRPGEAPLQALSRSLDGQDLEAWLASHAATDALVVVDQLEELLTLCGDDRQRAGFLDQLRGAVAAQPAHVRLVITLRSDFGPHFRDWIGIDEWEDAQFAVAPLTQDELREVIERPASERVLHFEPRELVDRLINDVVQTPGALALLSFALSELYLACIRRERDRALTLDDYLRLGRVAGALTRRATAEYDALVGQDPAYRTTIERVMLRMVSAQRGELARRRVPLWELDYDGEGEPQRVAQVLQRFADARLLVLGHEGDEDYAQPAHDMLVLGWEKLLDWKARSSEALALQRLLTPAAREWKRSGGAAGFLWHDNPRLLLLEQELAARDGWLNQLETAFVQRSLARRRRNRRIAIGLAAILVVLTVWAGIASLEYAASAKEAVAQSEQARANALRARANEKEAVRQTGLAKTSEQTALANAQRADRNAEQAEQRRREADDQRDEAQRQRREVGRRLARAYDEQGRQLLLGGNPFQAASYLSEAYHAGLGGPAIQTLLARAMASIPNLVLRGHRGPVVATSFSHDGARILTSGEDGTVRIWDAETGRPVRTLRVPDVATRSAVFSPDDARVVAAYHTGQVIVWDAASGTQLLALPGDPAWKIPRMSGGDAPRAWLSADGTRVITTGDKIQAATWDAATGEPWLAVTPDGIRAGNAAVFSAAGTRLLQCDAGDARIWDVATRALVASWPASSVDCSEPVFSPDGERVLLGSVVWHVATQKPLARLEMQHRSRLFQMFSGDGQWILTGGTESAAHVWDAITGKELARLPHGGLIWAGAVSPDGKRIGTAGGDQTVRIWDRSGRLLAVYYGHDGISRSLTFSPDGRRLVSASDDGTARVWTVPMTDPARSLDGFTTGASRDGSRMWATSRSGSVTVRDTSHGALISSLQFPGFMDLAVSPDARYLAASEQRPSRTWSLWSLAARNQIHELTELTDAVSSGSFSADGSRLVTQEKDRIRVWALPGMTRGVEVPLHGGRVETTVSDDGSRLAIWGFVDHAAVLALRSGRRAVRLDHGEEWMAPLFSPDGRLVAARSEETGVWDPDTGRRLTVLRTRAGNREAPLAWSPTGDRLLTGGGDGEAHLWEIVSGRLAATLSGQRQDEPGTGGVSSAAFSRDGSRIVTMGASPRIWDAATGQLLIELPIRGDGEARFAPDDAGVVVASGGKVSVWEVPIEHRPPALVAELVDCYVPFALDSEQLVTLARPPCSRASLDDATPPPAVSLGDALFGSGTAALQRRDYANAQRYYRRAIDAYRAANEPVSLASSYAALAVEAGLRGDLAAAQVHGQAARAAPPPPDLLEELAEFSLQRLGDPEASIALCKLLESRARDAEAVARCRRRALFQLGRLDDLLRETPSEASDGEPAARLERSALIWAARVLAARATAADGERVFAAHEAVSRIALSGSWPVNLETADLLRGIYWVPYEARTRSRVLQAFQMLSREVMGSADRDQLRALLRLE